MVSIKAVSKLLFIYLIIDVTGQIVQSWEQKTYPNLKKITNKLKFGPIFLTW